MRYSDARKKNSEEPNSALPLGTKEIAISSPVLSANLRISFFGIKRVSKHMPQGKDIRFVECVKSSTTFISVRKERNAYLVT